MESRQDRDLHQNIKKIRASRTANHRIFQTRNRETRQKTGSHPRKQQGHPQQMVYTDERRFFLVVMSRLI